MKMRLRAIGSRRDGSGKAVFAVPGVTAFEGIPYAAAPVGKLRWASPQPVPSWPVVRNAHRFMSGCVQNYMGQILWLSWATMNKSEDCLYLNVWTPAKAGGEKLPVMVWIVKPFERLVVDLSCEGQEVYSVGLTKEG
jgi:hypothetical protein